MFCYELKLLDSLYALLNVQTPLQTPIQTPLPGTGDNSTYNIPTGPSDYPSSGNDTGGNADVKGGRPATYMVKLILPAGLMIYHKSIFNIHCQITDSFICSQLYIPNNGTHLKTL